MMTESAESARIGRTLDRLTRADRAFLFFFSLYTAMLVVWLLVGLGPPTARISPTLLRALHRWASGGSWVADLARRVGEAAREDYAGKGPVPLYYLLSVLNLGLGILLVWLRPRDRVARLLAVGMIGTAATFNLPSHSFTDVFGGQAVKVLHVGFHFMSGVAYMYAVALFPDGKLVPRWSVRPLRTLYLLVSVGVTFGAAVLVYQGSTIFAAHFVVFFGLLIPIVGVAAQTYRYRRPTTEQELHQAAMLRWALLPAFGAGVVYLVASVAATRLAGPIAVRLVSLEATVIQVFPALFAIVPVVLFVAIVRRRLWDIDLVINKALLYGALAVFIGAMYVLVVAGIGSLVGRRNSLGLAIMATALVAVAFQPARSRAQRLANRLVYGERASPYEVLAGFSERVAGAISIEEVLPQMAEASARGVGAARSQVRLFLPRGGVRAVAWPAGRDSGPFDRVISVMHRGEPVGEISVAKPPGDPLTPAEERLLADLASEAGLALHNVRLTVELEAGLEEISAQAAELRASRERIVAAQDAAARRLERNIHDGAQQQLVSLMIWLRVAEGLVELDPVATREALGRLKSDAADALDNLRDLARGIYPALLADKGLGPAIVAQANKTGLSVAIEYEGLRRYSPETEFAVYFCCLEALQNVAKYAASSRVLMCLEDRDGWLTFSVADDGGGFDPERTPRGSGLQNMADRLAAIGGTLEVRSGPAAGTTISGRVPSQIASRD